MERCDGCKWYEPGRKLNGIAGGTCMVNPPVVLPVPQQDGSLQTVPLLPPVAAQGRCEKHKPRLLVG